MYLFISVLHSSLLWEAVNPNKNLTRFLLTFLGMQLLINTVFWIDVHFSSILCKVSQSEIPGVACFVSWRSHPSLQGFTGQSITSSIAAPASLGPCEMPAGLTCSEVLPDLSSWLETSLGFRNVIVTPDAFTNENAYTSG